LSNALIDDYCKNLHYNTLGIKWFMHSVSVGKRPTVILSDQKQFLQFCLQNVFNSLSPDVILIAKLLANVGGLQTVASLAFYSDLDSLAIQGALSVLITSNLVTPERGRNVEDEELYGLSSLSRAYIHEYIRMDADEQKRLFRKQKELRSTKDEMNARAGRDTFDINYVFVRDENDIIVANILTKAISKIFQNKLPAADMDLTKAEDLNPNYFEVHRVRAFYYLKSGDYLAAGFAYDAAISLAPDRAPLRMWYGGFLSRNIGDQRAALDQLVEAERLAPTAVFVKLECARVMQYLRQFKEAEAKLSDITNIDAQSARTRRVHLDLMIQNNIRRAEFEVHEGNFKQALHYLERARDIFTAAPSGLIDFRTVKGLYRARICFPALRRAFLGLPEAERLLSLEVWMPLPSEANPTSSIVAVANEGVVEQISDDSSNDVRAPAGQLPNRGRLIEVHDNYGFVDAGGSHYFFHRGQWRGTTDFTQLEKGSIVRFELETQEDGRIQATGVKPVYDSAEDLVVGTVLSGSVKTVQHNHGFIALDVGVDLFFHRSQCGPGTRFNKLMVGDRVQCTVGTSTSGRPEACSVELFSGTPLH
jgi:LuxR family transcriptional regulator, glucitol operon activator